MPINEARENPSHEPILRPVMPELDSVRGLAILGVLIYHGLYWGVDLSSFPRFERLALTATWAGRLGVNLFFVLSGFLITGLLLDARSREDYYKRFYIRRALRILPAYFLVILVLALTKYTSVAFLLLSLGYLSNLTPLVGVGIGYPILWSLAVEEHFYFLWPALVRRVTHQALLWCCAGIVLFSPLSRLASYYATVRDGFAPFVCNEYTWNSLDGLACGAILAIVVRESKQDKRVVRIIGIYCVLTALALWITGIPFGILSRQHPYGAAMQIVPWQLSFVALLCLFLLVGTSDKRWIVQLKSLRFLGEISYGLYLVHLLVFNVFDGLARRYVVFRPFDGPLANLIFRLSIAGGSAILVAWFSRRQFEERFLRLKERFS